MDRRLVNSPFSCDRMKLLKSHPLLSIANSYTIDSPAPSNLSYIWNFGSLLGSCLVLQIITGVTLATHYCSDLDLAFNSVERVMRDINYGWLIRYLHANGAAFFFLFVYAHIGKGLYYGSYRTPRALLWSIGVAIFLIMVITAFLGYLNSLKWNSDINVVFQPAVIFFTCYYVRTVKKKALCKRRLTGIQINPLAAFEDLHLEKTRTIVKNATKGLSGIYMIVNLVNGKYI